MCITKECDDPTEAGVYFREDDCWVKYSPAMERAIRNARKNESDTLALGMITSSKYPGGRAYSIDFSTMEQVNLRSGYRREIKIIDTPEHSFMEHVVEELLQLIKRENFLKKVIMDAYPGVKDVRSNKALEDKPQIYNNFLDALKQAAENNKDLIMEMFWALKQSDSCQLKSLEFVFHGTPSENLQSIMGNGLDPNLCRNGGNFWVGKDPSVSFEFCRTSTGEATMVLFLELCGHGETKWDRLSRRNVPNTKSSVLLPVAEIDFGESDYVVV